MKVVKLLTLLTIPTLALSSVSFGLIGCGKPEPTPPGPGPGPEPWTDETPEQYINNRTFSLLGAAYVQVTGTETKGWIPFTYGTGWIIGDSTKGVADDYNYYVATNWHVIDGFDSIAEYDWPSAGLTYLQTIYFFADASCLSQSDDILISDDYILFKNNKFEKQDVSDFLFDENDNCIDFYVANADFSSILSDERGISIKKKLDFLNSIQAKHGYINKFVNSSTTDIIKKDKYVGGYPYKDSSIDPDEGGGKWESHSLSSNQFQYKDSGPIAHYVDTEQTYLDISNQYVIPYEYPPDWMDGGASGSMLITVDNEICGIYWGGATDKKDDPTWLKPQFSILKDTTYDFVTKWK